jgi:hypothetical protein
MTYAAAGDVCASARAAADTQAPGSSPVQCDRRQPEAAAAREVEGARVGRLLDEQPLAAPQAGLQRDRDGVQRSCGDDDLLGRRGQPAGGVALGDPRPQLGQAGRVVAVPGSSLGRSSSAAAKAVATSGGAGGAACDMSMTLSWAAAGTHAPRSGPAGRAVQVPAPWRALAQPWSRSRPYAAVTVERLSRIALASSRSGGRRQPTGRRPSATSDRTRSDRAW